MESRNTKRSIQSKRKHTKKLCLVLRVVPQRFGIPSVSRAYSSAGLERTPDKREVDGSSPFRPIDITNKKS